MSDEQDPFTPYSWRPSREMVQHVATEYDTPTFVYSEVHLQKVFDDLQSALGEAFSIFYSLKANPCLGVTQTLVQQGAGCEVSSRGELYAARRAGGSQNGIIFVGPGKNEVELRAIASSRDIIPVCESFNELEKLNALRPKLLNNGPLRTLIRVNPAFHTKGARLSMGGKPRQFGIDEAALFKAKKFLESLEHIDVIGFHAYLGTRILDVDTIADNTGRLLTLYTQLASTLDISLKLVDVGGGFGVPYYPKEVGLSPEEIAASVRRASEAFRQGHPNTEIIIELGRYLTAGAGVMLVRVLDIKESRGKTFAVADGGTNVHMAANGLGSFAMKTFPIIAYTDEQADIVAYTVSGPLCTPNDLLAKDIELRRLEQGSLIGVLMSGAYGPSASPTGFLSHGSPAEVLITGSGDSVLLVRRPDINEFFERQYSK